MKRIEKITQTTPKTSQTINEHSESTEDTYSCNYLNDYIDIEDVKSKITFDGNQDAVSFMRFGKLVIINYQGKSVPHSDSEVLFTIPVELRPKTNVVVPFSSQSASYYGALAILISSGNCIIQKVTSTTAYGRLCFNVVYSLV